MAMRYAVVDNAGEPLDINALCDEIALKLSPDYVRPATDEYGNPVKDIDRIAPYGAAPTYTNKGLVALFFPMQDFILEAIQLVEQTNGITSCNVVWTDERDVDGNLVYPWPEYQTTYTDMDGNVVNRIVKAGRFA